MCFSWTKEGNGIRFPIFLKNNFQLKLTEPTRLSQIERNYFQGKLLLCQSSEMNLYSNSVANEASSFFPEHLWRKNVFNVYIFKSDSEWQYIRGPTSMKSGLSDDLTSWIFVMFYMMYSTTICTTKSFPNSFLLLWRLYLW